MSSLLYLKIKSNIKNFTIIFSIKKLLFLIKITQYKNLKFQNLTLFLFLSFL